MNEIIYIDDPRGGRVPLTDGHGNLTVDAMFLYNQDLLSQENKLLVDDLLADDEMARDALEGYALMSKAKEAKVLIADINSSLGTEKQVAPTPIIKLDYRKLSAAAAVLLLVGIGAFVGYKFVGNDQIAENTVIEKDRKETEKEVMDNSLFDRSDADSITSPSEQEQVSEEPNDMAGSNETEEPESELIPIDATKAPSKALQPEGRKSTLDLSEKEQLKTADAESNREQLENKLIELQNQKVQGRQTSISTMKADDDLAAYDGVDDRLEKSANVSESEESTAYFNVEESISEELDEVESRSNDRSRSAKSKERSVMAAAEAPQPAQALAAEVIYSADQVDQSPRFPGGDLELFRFIEKRKIHPANLKAQGIEGEVFVSFLIDADGSVTNVTPLRSDHNQLESDAIRVIRSMPKWQAAKKGGYPVKVKKTILIKYNLDQD